MTDVIRTAEEKTVVRSPEARANRRLVLELRDEISENSGYRTESQDWSRAYELIESLLEVMP
jgi:hypothetical protein